MDLEIAEDFNSGTPRKDIVKMGYPNRCDSLLKDSYFIVS